MKSWKIQDRDIVFGAGRIEELTGAECLCQRLENRIKLFTGEWFLAPDEGFDWVSILGQKSSAPLIYAELRRTLLADEEVSEVLSIDMEYSGADRTAAVTFSINSVYGEINGGTDI